MEIYKGVNISVGVPATEVLQNIRILFADDSKETLAVFKTITKRLGWKGTYASNALEIIEAANNLLSEGENLDAVVADINYFNGPKVTGITAAREIRKVLPDVPIVFITAYVSSIIKEEVRRVNAEIYKKPFSPENLFVRLSQLIYWNRLAVSKSYKGTDRRKMSVNLSVHQRRATDQAITTPERIHKAIAGL